jgi:ERCC4-type nuclease
MELIIDDRERAVIKPIEDIHSDGMIKYKVTRLEAGDYAIMYRNYIMILIERKTWCDLAASLRDGRKNNINKLFNVREQTGCQIAYLIEGNPCPKSTKKYGNMPIKNLRAHLDHIAFRDGVHMLYTLDVDNTAERLFDLARNFSTIKPSMIKDIDNMVSTVNTTDITTTDTTDITTTDTTDITTTDTTDITTTDTTDITTTDTTDINTGGNVSKLTEKQATTISVQEQLLMCLPSIGSIVATIMAENNISLYNLYNGDILPEQVARYKYPTGNAIGLTKSNKIFNSIKHMSSESVLSKKIQVRLLSTVPSISKKTAEIILSFITFKSIMDYTVTTDFLKIIVRGKTMLGNKASVNILTNILNITVKELDIIEGRDKIKELKKVCKTVKKKGEI